MANAEIEALRREHTEKVRQIAEKRKQVEDLGRVPDLVWGGRGFQGSSQELKRQRADRPARRTGDRR